MTHELVLSETQLSLMLELLYSEQKELLVEIRHTDSASFRGGLKERLATVESLIQKVLEIQFHELHKVTNA